MIRPTFLFSLVATCTLAALAPTATAEDKTVPGFGQDVQLAPFVVNGKKLSISVYARTKSDRKYGEEFAEEVVGIAYETLGKSTGNGLVIVGREGEPHPVIVLRKFLALAAANSLDPAVAAKADEINAQMKTWRVMLHLDDDKDKEAADAKEYKLTFDTIMPALPLPLEGVGSKLYMLSWTEDFDDARIEKKLRALTPAGLEADALAKYDWVFYLPPRNAYKQVEAEMINGVMKQEKMGFFKRAAIKSALVVFSPAIRTAVEGFRKGMLYMTVLRARSDYSPDDIKYLTMAYTQVLMPDFKFNGGTEHKRALEAIEEQKLKNAEYAKDPFVSPARLATFDPAAYAAFEGEYTTEKEIEKAKALALEKAGVKPKEKGKEAAKPVWSFKRKDDAYAWQYKNRKPLVLYPAGDRLFVSADGKLTMQFKLDEHGAVTGVVQRRERNRQIFLRNMEPVTGQIAADTKP